MNGKVLVLCPPNMTVSYDGPNGQLGDRIHQLPAVNAATKIYSKVLVWPHDNFTSGIFRSLKLKFIMSNDIDAVRQEVSANSIDRCICLFSEPINIPENRKNDAKKVEMAYEISRLFPRNNVSFPEDLNPRGQAPLWKKLLASVDVELQNTLRWPALPFFKPTEEDKQWAQEMKSEIGKDKPVIIASPFSGKPDETKPDFWKGIAAKINGVIFLPVHSLDMPRAQNLFGEFDNVKIIEADFSRQAALASLPGTHVIGIDGGPMNVLAASRKEGVLAIYSNWPASAWALPNVTPRTPDISVKDALQAMP